MIVHVIILSFIDLTNNYSFIHLINNYWAPTKCQKSLLGTVKKKDVTYRNIVSREAAFEFRTL